MLNDVKEFLLNNRKDVVENVEIQEAYSKKIIAFNWIPFKILCTIIIDKDLVYKNLITKIKTVSSFQPNLRRAFYDLQTEMQVYSLFEGTNLNSYIIFLMLILASQMAINNKTYIQGLKNDIPQVEKIEKNELINRFCDIFGSWLKNVILLSNDVVLLIIYMI